MVRARRNDRRRYPAPDRDGDRLLSPRLSHGQLELPHRAVRYDLRRRLLLRPQRGARARGRRAAWTRADYRHVLPDLVTRIMDDVLARYVGGDGGEGGMPQGALLSSARMLARLGRDEELMTLVGENRGAADRDREVLLLEAAAARRLDRTDPSFEALGKAEALAPDRPDALERMIRLCRPLRRRGPARELLDRHVRAFPDRGGFRDKVTWL
jgi:hypothetical protein